MTVPDTPAVARAALIVAQLVARLAGAIALALVVALVLTLLGGGGFLDRLADSAYVVGCVLLLMALAGHSPTMRIGTLDGWGSRASRSS